MTPEEILEKATNGELSKEDFKTEVEKLSPEDQLVIKEKASESATEELSKLSGIRKERQRLDELKKKDEEEAAKAEAEAKAKAEAEAGSEHKTPNTDDSFAKFREDQKTKAINKFQKEFALSDEDMTKVIEKFDQVDSQKIDADLIYQDVMGAYAFVNSDKLVSAEKEKQEREAQAAQENASSAKAEQGDSGGEKKPDYPEEIVTLAKEAGISEEAAQRVATEGMTRTFE